jgi:uncharacterized protein
MAGVHQSLGSAAIALAEIAQLCGLGFRHVGLHSATDAAYQWPAMGQLLGGRFNGHPVTGDLPITVLDAGHPATAHLRSPWRFRDELYLFRELVPDARVLLAAEFGGQEKAGLPVAWCIERPPARSFYTALGHFIAAYEDADYLQHVRGGIEWLLQGPGPGPAANPPR